MAAKTYLKTTLTVFAVLFLLAQPTFAALPRYEVIDLGTLGGRYSSARAINDAGQVVGWSYTAEGFALAFLWDPVNGMIDLGTLDGQWSHAYSINRAGQIVGQASTASGYTRAILFHPSGEGNNIDLGTLGGDRSYASSINDNGQIVGGAQIASGELHATLFDPTGGNDNIDLGTLGGDESWASSINNSSQIVGTAYCLFTSPGGRLPPVTISLPRAALFDPTGQGNNIDLGALPYIYGGRYCSGAESINDSGQIVGAAWNEDPDPFVQEHSQLAVLFDPNGGDNNIFLGTLGWNCSSAYSINNRDQIIGWGGLCSYNLCGKRPALFDHTGQGNNVNLYDLIDPSCGWILQEARSINNLGWIVGNGVNPAGQYHAFLMTPVPPKIIYVDADAAGVNDGSSWTDAYNYLQVALTAAWPGDEIRVAQGIYKPDQGAGMTPGDREATFQLINGVTLKGGYAGCGQPDPNARDIQLYETILSGDLNGDDGTDFENNDENSYHVVTGSETDATAVLDSFTITAGNGNGSYLSKNDRGGGMYNYEGDPTLTNCTFNNNSAFSDNWDSGGGAMYNHSSNPRLTNCIFSANLSKAGGGISNWQGSSPTLTNCTFNENSAKGSGGGMYNWNESQPTLTDCIFINNSVEIAGGGICNSGVSHPKLTNCAFISNSAYIGGGMFIECLSGSTVINCTFTGNSSGLRGGAIYSGLSCPPPGPPTTLPVITNCILYGNTPDELYVDDQWTLVVAYSDVQYSWPGEGNIDADPCFVDSGYWDVNNVCFDGDYHLLPDSPCIDAGDPNYITEPNETDLDGKPRVINGRIDMGAYESPIFAEAEIEPDTLNLQSKGKWITAFIQLPEEYNVTDIDPNSVLLEGRIKPARFWLTEDNQIAIAKFSREQVQSILEVGDINLTITGQLTDGTVFEGTDTIKVIDKGDKK